MHENLKIEMVTVSTLTPNPHNARTHSWPQLRQIEESIRTFGWTNPVLADEDYILIAGEARWKVAPRLGYKEIPAIRITGLSEMQKRALALADNKIPMNASWDLEVLAEELNYLCDPELEFDVTVTGFAPAEIDFVIEEAGSEVTDDRADKVPPVPEDRNSCVRRGDLWQLGLHQLMCGDATDANNVHRLMGKRKARMVFTDPPYNVPIDGHVSGLGKVRHRDFAMGAGEMTPAMFTAFLEAALGNLAAFSTDGSIHYVCMDWRHMEELRAATRDVYSELKNVCIWNKSNAGMGSLYRSKYELVFVFKNGTAPHINNIELGRHGRYRTNVWDYPGVNTFGTERGAALAMHPTVKPVAMVADAILDCSRRGDVVLDTFAGSGTTIIAAERSGRRAYAMELDPAYVETAIRRWQDYTGETAIHAETGLELEALRESRMQLVDDEQERTQSPTFARTTPLSESHHDG